MNSRTDQLTPAPAMATSASSARISLRPSTAADRDFLREVYASTRDEDLAQLAWPAAQREAFVEMQFDVEERQYRACNPRASFDVVEVDGVPAGRLYVDRRLDDIRIIDIALLPHFRRAGIGRRLIGTVLAEARSSHRSASIHVEVHDPAARLYRRLGFSMVADHGQYRLMEWRE